MSHTPGPWEAGRPDMGSQSELYGKWIYAGDKYIAMASHQDTDDWEQTMDNAYLIAAAPRLLAACRSALAWMRRVAPTDPFGAPRDEEGQIAAELFDAIATATEPPL